MNVEHYIDALALGTQLLEEYGLADKGWTMEISSTKRISGMCRYTKKQIEISQWFLDNEWEHIENTIRHELAHALVYEEYGPDHGHDAVWRRMCIRVGARPERTRRADHKSAANYNFVIRCEVCGREWKRYRVKRTLYTARHCGEQVKVYKYIRTAS